MGPQRETPAVCPTKLLKAGFRKESIRDQENVSSCALHGVLRKMPFFLPDYSCHVLFCASVSLQICFFPTRRPCIVFFEEAANLNFNRTNALKNWGKGGNKGKGIPPLLFILLKVKGPFASHSGGRNFWTQKKVLCPLHMKGLFCFHFLATAGILCRSV